MGSFCPQFQIISLTPAFIPQHRSAEQGHYAGHNHLPRPIWAGTNDILLAVPGAFAIQTYTFRLRLSGGLVPVALFFLLQKVFFLNSYIIELIGRDHVHPTLPQRLQTLRLSPGLLLGL